MSSERIMKGFPPPPEYQVTLANWRQPPYHRWAFQHVRQLIPTTEVANDPTNVSAFEEKPVELSALAFQNGSEGTATVGQMLDDTETDGFLVVHEGRVVMEEYRFGLGPATRHILMSVSKSITGTLAGILMDTGELDPQSPITRYVPEAADSVYGDATVRNLLDMTVGLGFEENYLTKEGTFGLYRQAMSWNPPSDPETPIDLRSFLAGLTGKIQEHGQAFRYASPNSDLLGWVLERASGTSYAQLLSEKIWRPIGAERSAYVTNDALSAPRSAGGICCTLRDLARFGLLLARGGRRARRCVVPSSWIQGLNQDGDRRSWERGTYAATLRDWPMRYRDQWYVMGPDDAPFFALGVFGQILFVDPAHDLVAAKFSSQPDPESDRKDCMVLRACQAIARELSAAAAVG